MKNIFTMFLHVLFIMLIGGNTIVLADALPKIKAPLITKIVKSGGVLQNIEGFQHPYIRIDTGWSKLLDTTIPVTKGFPAATVSKKVKSDFKPIIGLGVGFSFDKTRADITFYRHMSHVYKGSNNNTIKRKPSIDSYFLNVYWDIDTENNNTIFTPYMGVGIGAALIKDKVTNLVGTKALIKRKTNFAHRCVIGTTIDVVDNVKVDISYIYHHYGRSRSKTIDNNQYGRTLYKGSMITTGIRAGF